MRTVALYSPSLDLWHETVDRAAAVAHIKEQTCAAQYLAVLGAGIHASPWLESDGCS
jgi:hypothetical protein